jgi:hypothetical protein
MPDPTPKQRVFPFRTAIVAAVIVILAGLLLVAFLWPRLDVDELVGRFTTGTITNTFRSSVTDISSTSGDVLELATIQSNETFRKEDSLNVFWDSVYLGTTVAEIRAPVTFRYHLKLSDPWKLATRDNVCLVVAPPIRASLPPAIHTDQMEKSVARGWARFNETDILKDIETSMTPALSARAMDSQHIKLAREACRRSVADFVRRWLMKENQWRDDRFTSVVVVFPDEPSVTTGKQLDRRPD